MSTTVFVAGATGNLGSKIVTELVDRGATVRVLVREGKADGGDALRHLVSTGVVDVVIGDLSDDVAILAGHLEGVDVVVSAVQGGPDVIVDGQTNLLRAAEAAGVTRMIPSDFSADLHRLDYGDNLFLDMRKKADEAFAGSTVKPTFVLNGGFMEVMLAPFMGIVDLEHGTFSYWGDGEQALDFTSIPDTAAYAAAAALDESAADRTVSVAGSVLTMTQLHAEVEQATGRTLEIRELGTVDDLRAEIERRKQTATNPYEFVSLQYQWAMVTGKAKLQNLNNADYPDITPTTVAEFLATR
ncbi:NmrA family NAD(P)-binding protein [Agromyces seonyuensis]|uniref:NAD(P)H-binding protein n=1 Tax=Agromyces seonyuensis TaxID=2662446 RepID=A0A6I4NYN0_9MICO|nr:NmrA family NAD(P)-binding protein [Agromyces seonyuensis]MWB99433.1 NAD(P)H-binding protein [Agromyces seonyuensis]